MIKFSNFCGIFATLFVTTTIILLASCSQDDDYYESDMYTLAEMETRGGGGDPGGGQPSPVITHVDSITEWYELCFFPNGVFNSPEFQNSPLVAIDPSLYGASYIEVDAQVTLQRVDGVPQVTSFSCAPALFVYYPSSGNNPDTIPVPCAISSSDFEVIQVYLQQDGTPIPGRYLLYATGSYYGSGEIIPYTAFIPNHIFN